MTEAVIDVVSTEAAVFELIRKLCEVVENKKEKDKKHTTGYLVKPGGIEDDSCWEAPSCIWRLS